ncbi:hypothetical protein J3D48_001584 [Pseudomonas fluorescens]|jgi:hypothetical protein|uniref:TnsD family Tn7-like transposition protein n=1 Tax=Pseudomonas fluorescens TaxID=294 RepID=UPI00209D146B|nr:TnsD family Tn7-like transposition protein [Pseudomonas fluorescens]MCP1485271.1 hypothetical protein [Pseudomonas fluorescens]
MPPTILFFPVSMPDETLQSRITRYHLLSGNKTEADTFNDIFGTSPFSLQIIPKKIEDLAERLPGDKGENLLELLNFNTIFPLYKPFSGVSENTNTGVLRAIDEVARVPRREVSLHSMAKICLSCVSSDLIDEGFSYWHRAHHIPGVTACWKHGEVLLQACPKCSHPFYRANKLLPCLTSGCICGWLPLKAEPGPLATEMEKELARFAKDLLHEDLPAFSCDVLIGCYRRRAKTLGFRRGKKMATTELFNSIVSHFGPEVLSKIDKAFASGKHHQWIRTSTIGGVLDMPIGRHLVLSYYLFNDVGSFTRSLSEETLLSNVKIPAERQRSVSNTTDRKEIHRQKIMQLFDLKPDLTIDYLWAKAYQSTLWLNANDKSWIDAKLRSPKFKKMKSKILADDRDQEFADIICSGVIKLYSITQKQVRVNISNMLSLLPKKIVPNLRERKLAFPLVSVQLEKNLESLWHYRLRRVIWGISEMHRLKLIPNTTSLNLLTTVPCQAWTALVEHFEWDLEKIMSDGVEPEMLLARAGVSRQWEGPPGHRAPMGGRSYIAIRKGSS